MVRLSQVTSPEIDVQQEPQNSGRLSDFLGGDARVQQDVPLNVVDEPTVNLLPQAQEVSPIARFGQAKNIDVLKANQNLPSLFNRASPENILEATGGEGGVLKSALQAGMIGTQRVLPAALEGLNQVLGNMPRSLLRKFTGKDLPQGQGALEKTLQFGAGVAGFTKGVPLAMGNKLAANIIGKGALQATLRGGTSLATAGAVQFPTDDPVGIKQRVEASLIGGLLGLATGAFGKEAKIPTRKRALKLAKDVEKGVDDVHQALSDGYDRFFKAVKGEANNADELIGKLNTILNDPNIPNVAKNKLNVVLEKLTTPNQRYTSEFYLELKNLIRKSMDNTKNIYRRTAKTSKDGMLKEAYHGINEELGKIGGSAFEKIQAGYKDFINKSKLVLDAFKNTKEGITDAKLLKNLKSAGEFQGSSLGTPTIEATKDLVPQLLGKIGGLERGQLLKEMAKKFGGKALSAALLASGLGGAGFFAGRALIDRFQGGEGGEDIK